MVEDASLALVTRCALSGLQLDPEGEIAIVSPDTRAKAGYSFTFADPSPAPASV